jgi:hypothetical protein
MRLVSRICRALVSLGLVAALTGGLTGCEASGSQKTEYKPIQTDILKKLGPASQAQSDAAKAEHPSARSKNKKRR